VSINDDTNGSPVKFVDFSPTHVELITVFVNFKEVVVKNVFGFFSFYRKTWNFIIGKT